MSQSRMSKQQDSTEASQICWHSTPGSGAAATRQAWPGLAISSAANLVNWPTSALAHDNQFDLFTLAIEIRIGLNLDRFGFNGEHVGGGDSNLNPRASHGPDADHRRLKRRIELLLRKLIGAAADMRLVQYCVNGGVAVGAVRGGGLLQPLTGATTLLDTLRRGSIENLRAQVNEGDDAKCIQLSDVKLLPPVTGGDKVIGVGLNYRGHCMEQKLPIPEEPIFFSKFPNCIIADQDPIKLRAHLTKSVDWEVELAVIIGKEARDVSKASALDYVAGYTVAQDVSARDWQKKRNGGQFLLGKSMDTFCPMGPMLVTTDEVPDPHNLSIQCSINGQLMQKGNTNELIYRIDDVIERLSSLFTLLPGDIILTGTPSGVGAHRSPPQFLQPGDKIVSQIESIGILNSPVELYVPSQN